MIIRNCIALLIFALVTTMSMAEEFRILAWNVESNRPDSPPVSDANVIGAQLKEMLKATETKSQIIALCEVSPRDFENYRWNASLGVGGEVDFVTSASGGYRDTDSLMLIVDKSRFLIDTAIELHRFAGIKANFNIKESDSKEFGDLRARSPLAVRLIDRKSNLTFWLVVNHLARTEDDLRVDQAKMLVKWAKSLNEPAISAGDHNFDWDFKTEKGNAGFDAMIEGEVWQWVKPNPLIDSNWSDDRRVKDRRVDRYPDSILDFVFVANQAKSWKTKSNVVVREGDFPDDEKTSDHRPILATLSPQ
jgi:endonuclease/exonuclease/phosphatase family metal-dependent hydrolase